MASLLGRIIGPYREGLATLDRRARVVALCSALFVAARMSLVTFLGIYFVRERGFDATTVGAALFVESMSRGLAAPLMGALSDRVGRRPLLLAHVTATALLLPAFRLVRAPGALFAWSVAVGLAQGPYFPISSALLLDLVPPERRQSALSVNYTAVSIGFTLGVAPAGLLAARGFEWLALASFLGAAAVAVIYAVALRGPLPKEAATQAPLLASTSRALRDPRFLLFASLALVFPLGIGLVTVPISLYAADSGVSDALIGLALSLNGLLVIALAVPANARMERSGPYRFLPLAAAFLALCYLALAVAGTFAWMLVAVTLFSFGEVIFSSAAPAAVASLAPAGLRGAYQGAWGLVFALGIGLATLLAGIGRDAAGWRWTWILATLAALAAGAGLVALGRRADRARRRSAQAPPHASAEP